ncbi:MAG: DUF2309 domain-containing protein [Planctomycetes bacterium]|nr:DUF2309 domain-containing protein [Planctomycetota bacterium]
MVETRRWHTHPTATETERRSPLDLLSEAIEHGAHLLPAQGPITVFIHHNTLHAFEDLPFAEAVKEAAHVFGCQPYLSEDQYRAALQRGRIRFSHLQQVLEHDLGDRARQPIPCFGTRLDLQTAMLLEPLRTGPSGELAWYVAEEDALQKISPEVSAVVRAQLIAETRRWVMRDLRRAGEQENGKGAPPSPGRVDHTGLFELVERFGSAIETWTDDDWEGFTLQALWRVCCEGVRGLPAFQPPPPAPIRPRDLLLELTGVDSDLQVNNLLIRFVGAFLDQGFATSEMPFRNEGFLNAFCAIYGQPGGPPDGWLRHLPHELQRLQSRRIAPLESIRDSLQQLGVPADDWRRFIAATLLTLRGWGGMLHQVEERGDRAVHAVPQGSLVEFLAIRLLLDRLATAYVARQELQYTGPLKELGQELRARLERPTAPADEQRALLVFQLAQLRGVSPDVLSRLGRQEWGTIVREIEAFTGLERRRIFHLAYERRFSEQVLDAVAIHAPAHRERPAAPRFQVSCCLDEREESFRRHLEEATPDVETFGTAGFYSVAMYYRGVADAHFTPLCPVVVRPQHWVTEEVPPDAAALHHRRARTRRAIGAATHSFHRGTRSIASGTLLTGLGGVLATFPLIARILFPRVTAKLRKKLAQMIEPPTNTRLHIERHDPTCGPWNGQVGFTVEEMTGLCERLLRDMGLTANFARLVVMLGHGSDSMNNPYVSAYNCGACGGSSGGPNARAMAQMLNDRRVRAGLAQRGLNIPDETVFVGGLHNTCRETVDYFDVDEIPATHRQDFQNAREALERACDRNAHERCRRFMSAPLNLTYREARLHVEARSEDLAQTRPELGHATNGVVVVGRREWTRGLFLDRRAFLASYDPTQDDDQASILTRILQAVFPVCAGINLEYYFSRVDNFGYGSGTKLPHNLASLLGVMDGAASDLRTGLPWQMVEIHEPVRSQFVIETTPAAMLGIMERNAEIGRLCRNGWVQLAVLHPETRQVFILHAGEFVPYAAQSATLPQATSSVDWYRGWRDHLEFCQIESGPKSDVTAAR